MKANKKSEGYLPIEDYGIIGNLKTVALVSLYGSIDYMCFPRFDSPSVFCKLLDTNKGGFFSISPQMKDVVVKQLYLPDTNVLVSRFFSDEGIAEIIDYMPVEENEAIVRRVSTIRGKINYKVKCAPRFNYASVKHQAQKNKNGILFNPEKADQPSLILQSEIELNTEGDDAVCSFDLKEDDVACFVLQNNNDDINEQASEFVKRTYQSTINFWQKWIAQSNYEGHWEEVVRRSALTLKLLISEQFGSMVAAPTFSFPESIGGSRNWDYRFTWIRDAAFTMHAFLQLGFLEEAQRFLEWVKDQSTKENLQLMFAIDGNTHLDEKCLDYLEGYKCSQPVRIGNQAHRQTQMDIYGELLETIYIFVKHGGDITYEYWKIIEHYVGLVIDNWKKPDHSIWEVRGEKREFLFSKMMCWVALDRAIKIGEVFSYPYDLLKWHSVRNEIYEDVYNNYWSEKKQAFVQSKGSENLDASALLMPILNMISPHSERWKFTVDAIDKELRSDVLVYRYREQQDEIDGLKGKEGTFTMCSFWFVECLSLSGQIERAKENFEKMLGYANHLGLYAEQLGMKGEHLGNFPQAFTHLALISAAIELSGDKNKKAKELRTINRQMK
ncbi:MAG TPA: glycoside hydrolase family 15 protein [Flavisolibacter sp.]|jgi:GH15 family glucan-1,4-alpha-glucosidase|nr:glycoside hydrolase family 15 protein [Flavisolibacter sp.]